MISGFYAIVTDSKSPLEIMLWDLRPQILSSSLPLISILPSIPAN